MSSGGVTICDVGIRIEKVDLPGIGFRHDLVTEGGRRISVVSHRDGERDLGVFDVDDPDECRDTIALSDDEAVARASYIWDTINAPNLMRNIAPTQSRATIILRKGPNHHVESVSLRKL